MISPRPSQLASSDPAAKPFTEAMAHHQAGRFPEAEKCYRAALALAPEHGDAARLLGTLYLQDQKPEQALPWLRAGLKAQPKNPEIFNNLGIALRDTGAYYAAEAQLREALVIKPDYAEAANNLGTICQALGRIGDAVPLYEKAVQLRPDYIIAIGNLAAALSQVGDYQHSIACYEKALQAVPREMKYWMGQGLAHEKLRQFEEAFVCLQQALLLKNGDPIILSHMGNVLRQQGRLDAAIDCYNHSLQNLPENPELYVNLGSCWWEKGNLPVAIHCFELALTQKPEHLPALVSLGAVLWGAGRREEGRAKIEQALRVNPDDVAAVINYGIMFYDEGKPEEALHWLDCALALDPNNKMAKWRKSFVLLALGQYREGWELYEAGLGDRNKRGEALVRGPSWDGKPMPGKHLLIWSEQGLGDSLQFIRYAAEAKKQFGKISVLCPRPLVRLLQSQPYIDEAVDVIDAEAADAHIPMLSLPHRFGTVLETVSADVPYLIVDAELQKSWQKKFDGVDGFKIGLVWNGSRREGQVGSGLVDERRSIALEGMKVLLDRPGTYFYGLQKDDAASQIKALGLEGRVVDFMPEVNDFADTAALIMNLDLVITVDTSVAHLAGALGKPVWILSRFDACWRWLKNQSTSPWYPTARIFGQPTPGDWDSVITVIDRELAVLLSRRGG